LFCESANNKTICEVSLTVTEPITRDMQGKEIKCVYADEREEIEKARRELLTESNTVSIYYKALLQKALLG
jgi:hypothetical protein